MSKKKKEWRAEKERLLSLGLEDRRKDYRGNYVPLDKIPIWANHDNNTANSSLLGGGGVDGCIHRAAGHLLYEECHSLNGCDTGKAKITCGYDLPAKYVIHTVGPIARGNVGQSQRDDLESCYKYSLKLMKDNNLRSVAFPCISTGIYGFPNEPAAEIALKTVQDWILSNQDEEMLVKKRNRNPQSISLMENQLKLTALPGGKCEVATALFNCHVCLSLSLYV